MLFILNWVWLPFRKKLLFFIDFTLNRMFLQLNFKYFVKWYQTWAQKTNVSYTYSYKKEKFPKLKYLLIIMIKHFFSFYNIFSVLNKLLFFIFWEIFETLKVHDHTVVFFLLVLYKDFDIFHDIYQLFL